MPVVDTLITEYRMDAGGYVAGAASATAATRAMSTAVTAGSLAVTAYATAVTAVGAASVAFGVFAVAKAAEFDALVKALEAVVGSAKGAKSALEELQEIAALPGLGLEEALRGYTALRRAGLTDSTAMRTVRAAGNANALASGGREDLQAVLRAIAQIAMKPNLSGEELLQLSESGIPAQRIITDRFGTFDAAQLKKLGVTSQEALEALVEGLEAMPKAQGSFKNSIENLGMAVDMAVVGIGSGIASGLVGSVDMLATALDEVTKNKLFEILGSQIASVVESAFPNLELSADGLEGALVEVAVGAADVAGAMRNLKLNLEDMGNLWRGTAKASPLLGPVLELIERITSGRGKGDPSPGEQVRAEFENRVHAEQASKRFKERKGVPAHDDVATSAAEAAKEQTKLLARTANATERLVEIEIGKSTIGGSAYGDAALSPVNLSGGAPSGGFGHRLAGLLDARIAEAIGAMARRR